MRSIRFSSLLLAVAATALISCTAAEGFRSSMQTTGVDGGSGGQGSGGDNGSGGSVDPGTGGDIGSGGDFGGTGGDLQPPMDAAVDTPGTAGSGGMTGTGGSGGKSGSGGTTGTGGMMGSGGVMGSGGAPAVDGCAHANWTFTVSTLCDTADCANMAANLKDPPYAIDGNLNTRYTTGRAQGSAGQENVVLTFPHTVTLTGIHLQTNNGDGPANYRVEYATSGTTFVAFNPAVAGAGSDDLTITFPATTMKAFRVTQTGNKTPS